MKNAPDTSIAATVPPEVMKPVDSAKYGVTLLLHVVNVCRYTRAVANAYRPSTCRIRLLDALNDVAGRCDTPPENHRTYSTPIWTMLSG